MATLYLGTHAHIGQRFDVAHLFGEYDQAFIASCTFTIENPSGWTIPLVTLEGAGGEDLLSLYLLSDGRMQARQGEVILGTSNYELGTGERVELGADFGEDAFEVWVNGHEKLAGNFKPADQLPIVCEFHQARVFGVEYSNTLLQAAPSLTTLGEEEPYFSTRAVATQFFFDSFGHYQFSGSTGLNSKYWLGGSGTFIQGRDCWGPGSWALQEPDLIQEFTTNTSWTMGAAYWIAANPTIAASGFMSITGFIPLGPTSSWTVELLSDGRLRVAMTLSSPATTTILGTSVATVPLQEWMYIEYTLLIAASGMVEIKIDGQTVLSVSGVDTRNTVAAATDLRFTGVINGQSDRIADIYMRDDNTFMGDLAVLAVLPDGNGNYSQWTGSDGDSVDNYALIDDASLPATYVQAAAAGLADTYAMAAFTQPITNIQAVQSCIRARSTSGTPQLQDRLRIGGVDYNGNTVTLTSSSRYYCQSRFSNPAGGAWDLATINAMEAGQVSVGAGTRRVSQIAVEIVVSNSDGSPGGCGGGGGNGGGPSPEEQDTKREAGGMPKPGKDQVITQGHKRIFYQPGGPGVENPVKYAGVDGQYMAIQGGANPVSGGIDAVWVPDPRRLKRFQQVGRSVSPPDLPTADVMILEKHGGIPFTLGPLNCPYNFYIPTGVCKDLSDFAKGWSDYVEVYSWGEGTDVDLGDRTAGWDSDDAVETSVSYAFERIYAIGAISFSEKGGVEVSREVVDVVYGSVEQCGDCGPQDDGTKRVYAVTKSSGAGSPGLPAEVVYTVDGGATVSQTNIDNMGATEDPLGMDVVGDKLVVLGADAYYWATINSNTGVPGTWTKVSTGFVATKTPRDLFVLSPQATFFVGDGGYIYKSTDITTGVSVINAGTTTTNNLLRIHGDGADTMVAVGAASTVIRSTNGGGSWATTVDSNPVDISVDIYAVLVLDNRRYWIGTALSGRVAWTINGGETWTPLAFDGSGAGTVYDIVAATDEVIYFSHSTNTPTARIFSTWNGGANFTRESPRLVNVPTFNRANRLAVPRNAHPTIASSNLAVAGLSGGGTDGVLYLGVPAII